MKVGSSKSKQDLVFVISDVARGGLLLDLIDAFMKNGIALRVIVIGGKNLKILEELSDLGVSYQLFTRRSKFLYIMSLSQLIYELFTNNPKRVLSSGQLASTLTMLAGFATLVKKRTQIRHHSNLHHTNTYSKFRQTRGKTFDWLANFFATEIIAVSNVVKTVLVDYENVDSAKVRVINNGIDLNRFQGNISVRDHNRGELTKKNYPVIGVVSRLTTWKGVHFTAKAFVKFSKLYPNAKLIIIGEPSDSFAAVRETLSAVNPRQYVFRHEDLDITETFAKFDMFVHVPIDPLAEAFGLVFIEAMALGVPAIFTKSGVIQDFERPDDFFYMVPYSDDESIFREMIKITQNSKEKLPIDPVFLSKYSKESMTKRYIDALN